LPRALTMARPGSFVSRAAALTVAMAGGGGGGFTGWQALNKSASNGKTARTV
jgi:hypothetical protein